MTSDEFFASHHVKSEFSGRPLDLAFIDGMHRFEYALRDFINIERYSAPATIVLVHDCYPLDGATSARDRVTKFWSGDAWKLIVCLKKYRPDLSVDVLAAPPTGLGVIRRLDRKSTLLQTRLESLYQEFVPLDYSAVASDKRGALGLLPGSWGTARRLFD
jgi:methyltransferase family protein